MFSKKYASWLLACLAAAPAGLGQDPGENVSAPIPRFRARHILITWKGSAAAGPETKLTKREARKKADGLLQKLRDGGDFAALARSESVCRSRYAGGDLGQFQERTMLPQFEAAIRGAKVGELVGPIETPYGFHLIERLPIDTPWPDKIAASHILISWKDAERSVAERSKEEALVLATRLLGQLRNGEIDFAATAKQHSDDRASGARSGSLGTIRPIDAVPAFIDALVAIEVGELTGPVETQFGYHILRRDELPTPLRASHILVPWKGAYRAPGEVTRTKDEALALAKKLLLRARGGEDFAQLAAEFSTCPSKISGGDLREFQRGQMVQSFEDAVLGAKVGEIVGPVETQFGFHVIKRTQ